MVSLMIPCYNAGTYLERCLNSVLNQTFKDIELIVVNDGSSDNSEEIIENLSPRFENELTKFVYVYQKNKGVGAACNEAFKHATGEYLILLDTDDMILPESVEEQSKWLTTHPDYDIVRTNGYYVDEKDLSKDKNLLEVEPEKVEDKNLFEELFYGTTYLWPGSYMIRMSALDKLYPDHEIYPSRSGQNLQFLMMAAYHGKDGFIDKPLMRYTVRAESLSHFSDGDVLQKNVNAMLGYKNIRKYLIDNYIDSADRAYWNLQLELLYAGIFTRFAIKYKNAEMRDKYYSEFKKLNDGKIDWNLTIDYYGSKNKVIYYFLRLMRKLKIIKV